LLQDLEDWGLISDRRKLQKNRLLRQWDKGF
jgi:hypothetical protein